MGVGGFIEPAVAIWPLLVVTPFVAVAIIAAPTTSASRRPFPVETLISGAEGGSVLLLMWLLAGPVLAAVVVDIAFGLMRPSLDRGVTGSTFVAIGFLVLATLGFVGWLRTRKPPE